MRQRNKLECFVSVRFIPPRSNICLQGKEPTLTVQFGKLERLSLESLVYRFLVGQVPVRIAFRLFCLTTNIRYPFGTNVLAYLYGAPLTKKKLLGPQHLEAMEEQNFSFFLWLL
jgi:hypothetical protein